MAEPTAEAEVTPADVEIVVEGIMEEATAAAAATTTVTPPTTAPVETATTEAAATTTTIPTLEAVAPITAASMAAITMVTTTTTTAPATTTITTQKPTVTTRTTPILATETPANTDNCNNNNLEATNTTTISATITPLPPSAPYTYTPTTKPTSSADAQSSLGATPIHAKRPKARPSPYSKPILLSSDRRSRKKKRISWGKPSFHYFEHVADERINVYRMNADQQMQNDANACNSASAGSSLINPSLDSMNRRPNNVVKMDCDKSLDYLPWRPLILIDFTPELPSPGWNSIERSAQAERETYVLGAIDLPGQPSTLDEPDQQPKSSTGPSNGATNTSEQQATKEGASIRIIPLDNPEGIFSEFPSMYYTDIVNGVRADSAQQQSQQHQIQQHQQLFQQQQQQQQLIQQQQQQQIQQHFHGFESFPTFSLTSGITIKESSFVGPFCSRK